MLTVHVLGSGSGLPTTRRDTTSLLVRAMDGDTLVDCPGGVVHKLARVGVSPGGLRRVILTHSHVDHVYGLPHLIHAQAVAGVGTTLRLHAPRETLELVRGLVELHQLDGLSYPTMEFIPIPMDPGFCVSDVRGHQIRSTLVNHTGETVGLRFDAEGVSIAHSSDTGPCPALVKLARGVDLLFHDCGGLHEQHDFFGSTHSSALEAGRIAAQAGASNLRLIHVGVEAENDEVALIEEARTAFEGPVEVAEDGAIEYPKWS